MAKNSKLGKTAAKTTTAAKPTTSPTPANSASASKSAPSKTSACAGIVEEGSIDRCPVKCAVCEQNVVEGKDQALYCEGLCKRWFHRYCAGVSTTLFAALSSSSDPFLCAGCFQASSKKELVELKNTISILRDEVTQLRMALDQKNANDPATFRPNGHWVPSQDGEHGVRVRGRGRGRGGGRGSGGMDGCGRWSSRVGNNRGVAEECMSGVRCGVSGRSGGGGGGSGRGVGGGSGGRGRGVGGDSDGGGGGGGGVGGGNAGGGSGVGGGSGGGHHLVENGMTTVNAPHRPSAYTPKPLKNRVLIPDARKVWGTLRSTTSTALFNAIGRFIPTQSLTSGLVIKRKYKTSQCGLVKRWWFVIRGDLSAIKMLEQQWMNISTHTGWKLENMYCYEDSSPANVLPGQPPEQPQTSTLQPDNAQQSSTSSSATATDTVIVTHSEDISADGVTHCSLLSDSLPPVNTPPFLDN